MPCLYVPAVPNDSVYIKKKAAKVANKNQSLEHSLIKD